MTFTFTDAEVEFVRAQPLGRLATATPSGEPDVVAVLCIYRRSRGLFLTGSGALERTRRYHNARRNPRFSLVFDDITWDPYTIRGVKVTGSMEVRTADDELNLGAVGRPILVLRPERKWSWGIEEPAIDESGTFSLRVDGGPVTPLTTLSGT
jgi:pyridoxamine 5'-phosphate oxidase family protein